MKSLPKKAHIDAVVTSKEGGGRQRLGQVYGLMCNVLSMKKRQTLNLTWQSRKSCSIWAVGTRVCFIALYWTIRLKEFVKSHFLNIG